MKITNKNQVPQYLQEGAFNEALDASDEEGFEVPSDCVKPDVLLRSDEELRHLLCSLRFWGAYKMPSEILVYIMKSPKNNFDPLLLEFPEFKEHLAKVIALQACAPDRIITVAIELGLGLEVVRILREQLGVLLGSIRDNVRAAAEVDDLDSMIYIINKASEKDKLNLSVIIKHASVQCSMNCLQYFWGRGYVIRQYAIELAARKGRTDCVKFFHEVCGFQYSELVMWHAALGGNLATIRYLHETGCPWSERTIEFIARANKLDCLVYAHENGCPWGPSTCAGAALYGHLSCLQYVHQQGCPWDKETILATMRSGQLECLMYACENGCPWHEQSTLEAVNDRGLNHLKYAHRYGIPMDKERSEGAVRNDQLKCFIYAHQHGCPWAAGTCSAAARNGHLDFLVYAHTHGCPWGEETSLAAIQRDRVDCLIYACENGCPLPDTAVLEAFNRGHWGCLWYVICREGCTKMVLCIVLVCVVVFLAILVSWMC